MLTTSAKIIWQGLPRAFTYSIGGLCQNQVVNTRIILFTAMGTAIGQTPLQSFLGLQQDGVHGSDTRQPVTDQVQDNTDATDLPDQVQNLLLLHQHFASAAGQVSANKF
jgi:hypothetical protein